MPVVNMAVCDYPHCARLYGGCHTGCPGRKPEPMNTRAVIELTLPFPPSANRLWTRTRKGMRKTDTYSDWLRVAGYMAIAQRQPGLTGPYKLSIAALRPDRRRRDIDNLIKPVSDLLQSVGVIEDDCDCEMVTARWVTDGGPLTVRVEPVGVE